MPTRKDTAHRPSQSDQEFVRTKDGRRVRNTAFTGKTSASKSAAGAGLKPASVSAGAGASAPHPDSVSGQFSRLTPSPPSRTGIPASQTSARL